jgi:sRNA-binding carbon storage regulator CsrA
MLVLTRRDGQSVVCLHPDGTEVACHVHIHTDRYGRAVVRLVWDAPDSVRILRGEANARPVGAVREPVDGDHTPTAG